MTRPLQKANKLFDQDGILDLIRCLDDRPLMAHLFQLYQHHYALSGAGALCLLPFPAKRHTKLKVVYLTKQVLLASLDLTPARRLTTRWLNQPDPQQIVVLCADRGFAQKRATFSYISFCLLFGANGLPTAGLSSNQTSPLKHHSPQEVCVLSRS